MRSRGQLERSLDTSVQQLEELVSQTARRDDIVKVNEDNPKPSSPSSASPGGLG